MEAGDGRLGPLEWSSSRKKEEGGGAKKRSTTKLWWLLVDGWPATREGPSPSVLLSGIASCQLPVGSLKQDQVNVN